MPEITHHIHYDTLEELAAAGASSPTSPTWDVHTTPEGVEVHYRG